MPWTIVEHGDFRGGENLVDNESVLADNNAVLIENMLITGNGQVRKRRGMELISGTHDFGTRIDHIERFLKRSGDVHDLVFSGQKLYLADGTELINGLAAGPYGTEVMQDKFLFVDGENYYESDGTPEGTKPVELPADDDATLDEVKRCTHLVQHFDRIWATGDPTNPNAIYYTQTGRYDYFKGGDTSTADMRIGIITDDAEPAKIFIEMYGGLLFGKRTGWWLLTGDVATGMQAKRIIRGMGPTNRTFAIIDGADIWYIAEDGIRVLSNPENNVYATSLVSREQFPLFEAGDLSKAVLMYHDQRVLLSFKKSKTSEDNDMVAVADLRFRGGLLDTQSSIGAGSRITGWNITAIMANPDDGDLWAGLSDGKLVRLFEGFTDLGRPIVWSLKTPRYTAGDATLRKMYDGIVIHATIQEATSGFLSHYTTVDGKEVINTLTFQQGETKQFIEFNPRLIGTYIQHEIQSSSEGDVSIVALSESLRPLRPLRQGEGTFTR